VIAVLGGCTPGQVGRGAASSGLEPSQYCAAATAEGLDSWSGAVQTRCPEHDHAVDGPLEGCTHFRVDAAGAHELALPGVRRALDAGGGALVLWREDGALVHRSASGEERVLAGWANDPSVGSRDSSIAYLTVAEADLEEDDHGREPVLGAAIQVVLQSMSGAPEVLTVDPDAASPWPLPDGSGVLFVSTRTGVASLFRVRRGEEPVQLTNVGLEEVGQDFVPVPAGELVWLPDGRAVFATNAERDELWLLDPTSGDTERLGPGAHPRVAGGEVLAVGGTEGGCAIRYRIGGER
jgi:hypothetical protein